MDECNFPGNNKPNKICTEMEARELDGHFSPSTLLETVHTALDGHSVTAFSACLIL